MKVSKKTFVRAAKRVVGLIPAKLPTGMTEFSRFAHSICDTYGFPQDNDSYTGAIATMIMHLGPQVTHKAPRYFAKAIIKSQANQTAYAVLQAAKEAEKKKEPTEVTSTTQAT